MTFVVIRFFVSCILLQTEEKPTIKKMKIYINNKPTETSSETLEQLASELNLPDRGVAMAVGTQMVQRTAWAETQLKEEDSVIIIKAACGG